MIPLTITIDENILNTMRTDLYTFRQYATIAVLCLAAFSLILLLVLILQGIRLKNLKRELGIEPGASEKKYRRDRYDEDDEEEDEYEEDDEDDYEEDYEDEEEDSYEEEPKAPVVLSEKPEPEEAVEERKGYEEYDDEEEDDFVTEAYFARKREEEAERKAARKAEKEREKEEKAAAARMKKEARKKPERFGKEPEEQTGEADDDLEIMDLNDL